MSRFRSETQGVRTAVRVRGRDSLVASLREAVLATKTTLLLGPFGIGKTTVLAELARTLGRAGIPCGLAPRTQSLGDVTAALARTYLAGDTSALPQHRLRSRLRVVAEGRQGALLLDHVTGAGTALKGFLRSLRGTRLGVVLAADVENQEDHASARALHLTHFETMVLPLAGASMAHLLDDLLSACHLVLPLHEDDRGRLLYFARGNPGRLVTLVSLLGDGRFWRQGRLLATTLEMEATTIMLDRRLADESQ